MKYLRSSLEQMVSANQEIIRKTNYLGILKILKIRHVWKIQYQLWNRKLEKNNNSKRVGELQNQNKKNLEKLENRIFTIRK